jgi:membrane fusion protein (multidrug efflux system)
MGGPGVKPPPQKVTGYVARAENIPINLESSGTLLAWNEVQLMAEAAGKIVQINITEGAKVTQGQVLVALFDEDLKAQAKKQELQAAIAKKNVDRLKELVKINAASRQELDNAENQVNNIVSDLNLIQANLKKTKILAPFSGTIGLTNASAGTYVNPGNAVASLQEMEVLKLEFSIPEKYVHLLGLGDKVTFTTESQADTFYSLVYAFEPKIDPSTRTLKVRARFDNRNAKLLPGTYAKALLKLREIKNAVLIPTQSIIPGTRDKKVIVSRNGNGEFISVETGLRNKDKVQILKGILAGDTVLTSGLMFVKPGAELILTNVE